MILQNRTTRSFRRMIVAFLVFIPTSAVFAAEPGIYKCGSKFREEGFAEFTLSLEASGSSKITIDKVTKIGDDFFDPAVGDVIEVNYPGPEVYYTKAGSRNPLSAGDCEVKLPELGPLDAKSGFPFQTFSFSFQCGAQDALSMQGACAK